MLFMLGFPYLKQVSFHMYIYSACTV